MRLGCSAAQATLCVLLPACLGSPASAGFSPPKLVSAAPGGATGDRASFEGDVADDGRFVVFASAATNLIPGDANNRADVFLFDCGVPKQVPPSTMRISAPAGGGEADGESRFPVFSGDGRFIAFASTASNLAAGDVNDEFDVFVYDRDADGNGVFDDAPGDVQIVSVSSAGVIGNGESTRPNISEDGRFVVFVSTSTNLVSGDTNQLSSFDLFVHDRDPDENGDFTDAPGVTRRIGLDSDENEIFLGVNAERPGLSSDGRYVVFSTPDNGVVPEDGNFSSDVFLRDRDPDADGDFDEANALTLLVSRDLGGSPAGGSVNPDISGSGRLVAYATEADDVTPDDANAAFDIVLLDLDPDRDGLFDEGNEKTTLVSRSSEGERGDARSDTPRISTDGRHVIYSSEASNLVRCHDNETRDVYIFERILRKTRLVSVTLEGALLNGDSEGPNLSADGRFGVYQTLGDNSGVEDRNDAPDVFTIDLRPEGREVEPNDTFAQCTVIDGGASDRTFISGTLQQDCVFAREPKCALAAYGKPTQAFTKDGFPTVIEPVIAASSNTKEPTLLVPVIEDDRTVRLGVAAFFDAEDGLLNALAAKGLHGVLGRARLTIQFLADDSSGAPGIPVGDPVLYDVCFDKGREGFRLSYIAPEFATAALVSCDASAGEAPVAYDVDFFVVENLTPKAFHCVTVIGGVTPECEPTDTTLGRFNNDGLQITSGQSLSDDACEGIVYSQICVLSDDQGRLRFAVSGGGDLNFNGLADETEREYFSFIDEEADVSFQEFEPGASVKDASRACVIRYPSSVFDDFGLGKEEAPESLFDHGVAGGYCLLVQETPHEGGVGLADCGVLVNADPRGQGRPLTAESVDFNDDGWVNGVDLALLLSAWGPVPN